MLDLCRLAKDWDLQLRQALAEMRAKQASGQPAELVHPGLGEVGPVLLVLQEHPDKGPLIEFFLCEADESIGYWYPPGHMYNPLDLDGGAGSDICWPTFLLPDDAGPCVMPADESQWF